MIGFGAIVKSIAKSVDRAAEAIGREIRAAVMGRPNPKPCPIYVTAEASRRPR